MKIIKPSVQIMTPLNQAEILAHIERCGRTCYKSEDKITEDSAEKFVRNLIKRGHESVLEHYSFTVRFICDRGVSHELVRHRIASYSQESTRYCNYGNDVVFILPCYLEEAARIVEENKSRSLFEMPKEAQLFSDWRVAMRFTESIYKDMLKLGATPQEARAVLPNSLKTEVVSTMNLRQWRHVIKQRIAPAAHPQIREVMEMLLEELREKLPVVFEDIVKGGDS